MIPGSIIGGQRWLSTSLGRRVVFLATAILVLWPATVAALPKRLVLAIDGISYRDMKALQEGLTYKDSKGRRFHRQGFHEGYFPVSRLVSSFPSASDVAWTEIFGNRPLPGYQRTCYSAAANAEVSVNSVTTSMEFERQMSWRMEGGFHRATSYVFPGRSFKYEIRKLIQGFLEAKSEGGDYYAFVRSTDDAQHLSCDIFAMLCSLDEKLRELRALCRAREGRDLEILILSDHGNNHAGRGRRVKVRAFLKKAGYRVTKSILIPKDIVLPTAGIESWVEIHNSPTETESLVGLLPRLEGVDMVTAQDPGRANRFIVTNSKGARASVDWNPADNSFRYLMETGDPLDYLAAVEALSRRNRLDPDGFAKAEDWMAETISHRYPVALERIVRGHTRVTLNPATILVSLKNDYVHASWPIKMGSECVTFGGTHGALDHLNSNGILLSSFARTEDTSGSRVAALFDGFKGLRDYRAEENGAEWVSREGQSMITIARVPLDWDYRVLPSDEVFLRIWTPAFTNVSSAVPIEVTIKRVLRSSSARVSLRDPNPTDASEQHLTLDSPIPFPHIRPCERVYALPPGVALKPQKVYRISGRIRDNKRNTQVFRFSFRTDNRGLPVAY